MGRGRLFVVSAPVMNAPWPYAAPVQHTQRQSDPTWECVRGICVCHPVDPPDVELVTHHIVLFDEEAERMAGARCRIWNAGRLVNHDAPHADGDGVIAVQLGDIPASLLVEWAPSDTPLERMFPFRISYHVTLDAPLEEQVRRRLHNIGFCLAASLEQNVTAFQRVYGLPGATPTGRPEDIDVQLRAYHDEALLPPIARPLPTAAPPAAALPGTQGSARESLITEPFVIGVEVGDHVPWRETDDLVIVDASNEQLLRRPLASGHPQGGLRVLDFDDYEKNQRYTVKVRFGDHAFIMYQSLDIYDAMNPATDSPPPVPPQHVFVQDRS